MSIVTLGSQALSITQQVSMLLRTGALRWPYKFRNACQAPDIIGIIIVLESNAPRFPITQIMYQISSSSHHLLTVHQAFEHVESMDTAFTLRLLTAGSQSE